jgi:hypothetical protein
VKRALTVLGDLMWKPFDDRFADILERLRSYRDLIRLELSLSIAQSVNDAKVIAEAEIDLAREERRQDKKARERIDETANIAAETKSLVRQQRKGRFFCIQFNSFTNRFVATQNNLSIASSIGSQPPSLQRCPVVPRTLEKMEQQLGFSTVLNSYTGKIANGVSELAGIRARWARMLYGFTVNTLNPDS